MYSTPSASSVLIALRHFEQAGLIQISMLPRYAENRPPPTPRAPRKPLWPGAFVSGRP
ncbi:hypothetical protein SGPA1_31090 [Streptomyces misionensis JCM 4497]